MSRGVTYYRYSDKNTPDRHTDRHWGGIPPSGARALRVRPAALFGCDGVNSGTRADPGFRTAAPCWRRAGHVRAFPPRDALTSRLAHVPPPPLSLRRRHALRAGARSVQPPACRAGRGHQELHHRHARRRRVRGGDEGRGQRLPRLNGALRGRGRGNGEGDRAVRLAQRGDARRPGDAQRRAADPRRHGQPGRVGR